MQKVFATNILLNKLISPQMKDRIKAYLTAVKELEKTNNLTVTSFIQETLTNLLSPNSVPTDKMCEAATYMLKTGHNLKIFYENFIHVTPSPWIKQSCRNF